MQTQLVDRGIAILDILSDLSNLKIIRHAVVNAKVIQHRSVRRNC